VTIAGSLLAAAYVFRVLGHAFGHQPYPQRPVTVAREEWPALVLTTLAVAGLGLAGAPVWDLLEIGA
jgi:NADH:ubiquinone oxidoreductase subunit 2 (subunit N)